jgi:hypothetical protein
VGGVLGAVALWAYLKPHLLRRVPVGLPSPKEKLKGVQPQGLEEMVRCAASLELLPPAEKVELGGWITSRLQDKATAGGPWAWALGRLGARVPVHGAAHRVVDVETATAWVELLLTLDAKRHDGAPFALAWLARRTGDRARDLDDATRSKVLAALRLANTPPSWYSIVAEVMQISAADEARALGDSLPIGLTL